MGPFFYGGNAPANARAGRYRLDGYLIQILPDAGAAWIDRAGMSGPDMLVLGSTALFRVK